MNLMLTRKELAMDGDGDAGTCVQIRAAGIHSSGAGFY